MTAMLGEDGAVAARDWSADATSKAAKGRDVQGLAEQVDRLRQGGAPVGLACKRLGIAPSTYYRWRGRSGATEDLAIATPEESHLVQDAVALMSPSPWAAQDGRATGDAGPAVGSGIFWRSAFKAELNDSTILTLLTRQRTLPAPSLTLMAPPPRTLPQALIGGRAFNLLGALGLDLLARSINRGARALRRAQRLR